MTAARRARREVALTTSKLRESATVTAEPQALPPGGRSIGALVQAVVDEARTWVGTPYHHLGDLKGVGVDCAMLLVRVYAAVGLVPADLDPRPYAPDWHLHRDEERYLGWLREYAAPVEGAMPAAGDVVAYHFGRTFSHAGICIGAGLLLHAWRPARRVVISALTDADLTQRREGVPRAAQCWRLHALAVPVLTCAAPSVAGG